MASSKPDNLPEMQYRFLGRSGLQVSAISLGGWLTYGGHVDEGKSGAELALCLDSWGGLWARMLTLGV
jgi:hypothetical protein